MRKISRENWYHFVLNPQQNENGRSKVADTQTSMNFLQPETEQLLSEGTVLSGEIGDLIKQALAAKADVFIQIGSHKKRVTAIDPGKIGFRPEGSPHWYLEWEPSV